MKRTSVAALLLVAAFLTGCSSGPVPPDIPIEPSVEQGPPPETNVVGTREAGGIVISWLAGDRIAVTTTGSSTCPRVVVGVDGSDPARIVIQKPDAGVDCSADLAPTTSTFSPPSGWAQPADIRVDASDEETILTLR
jgi:hypothetical protein